MSEPIVFISHLRIKSGKLDECKQFVQRGATLMESSKPGTVAFLAYLNEDGTEVSFVHLFPDAEAMERHMEGAGDRARAAYELLEPAGFEIYGKAPEAILEMLKRASGSGATLRVKPQPLAGYIRLKDPDVT